MAPGVVGELDDRFDTIVAFCECRIIRGERKWMLHTRNNVVTEKTRRIVDQLRPV